MELMVVIFFGRFCLYRSSIFVHAVPLQEEHVEAWNDWTQGKKHKKLNKGVKRKGWWADNQQAKRDWKAAKKEERRKEQEKYVLAIKDGEEEDGWEDHNHLLGSGKVPAPATPPLTSGATSSLKLLLPVVLLLKIQAMNPHLIQPPLPALCQKPSKIHRVPTPQSMLIKCQHWQGR